MEFSTVVPEPQQPLCAMLLELKKADLMPSVSVFNNGELPGDHEASGGHYRGNWGGKVVDHQVTPAHALRVNLASKPADTRLQKATKSAMHSDLQPHYTEEMLLLLS